MRAPSPRALADRLERSKKRVGLGKSVTRKNPPATQLDNRILVIKGDTVQLQQVVLNLVMNAINSMRSVRPRVLSVKSKLNGHD